MDIPAAAPDLPETPPQATPQTLRVRLDFAYDGTDFSGWAAQPGRRTVEAELSAALTTLLRAGDPVRLTVAGRTDAGVHARGQVAHADLDPVAWSRVPGRSDRTPAEAALTRLNGILPADIVVRSVREAPAGFDARFSAVAQALPLPAVRRACPPRPAAPPRHGSVQAPARRRRPWTPRRGGLLGLADFAAFCKKREGATTVRTLLEYSWVRLDDGTLAATVVADAFCHSMVRALVGAVVPVGEGRRPVEWPAQVLAARRRDPAATVMPAHGLSLEEVVYPPEEELASRAEQARAVRALPE